MSGDDLNNIDDDDGGLWVKGTVTKADPSPCSARLMSCRTRQFARDCVLPMWKAQWKACAASDRPAGVLFEMLADKDNQTRTTPATRNDVEGQRPVTGGFQEQVVEAIAARLAGRSVADGNPFRNASMVEIGRRYLEASGLSLRGWGDNEVASYLIEGRGSPNSFGTRTHTTSDFPLLLISSANRALLERYAPMITPLKRLSHKRDAKDFRRQTFISPW